MSTEKQREYYVTATEMPLPPAGERKVAQLMFALGSSTDDARAKFLATFGTRYQVEHIFPTGVLR